MLSMISEQEKQYLYEFAKNEYKAQGEIVDTGVWMGASTTLLAQGLQDNGNLLCRKRIIHAYERFIWEEWMNPHVLNTPLQDKYKPGDSFFEECLRETSPWTDQIKFYPGDICQIGWHGGPIEFLFIDVMKSWELCNSVIHDFFPSLMPGISTVVHQDFSHDYTYWIHLIVYRFRDYFQPIRGIIGSGSFIFKYQKAMPNNFFKETYSLSSFSLEEVKAAFEYSKSLVPSEMLFEVKSAERNAYKELSANLREGVPELRGQMQQVQIDIGAMDNILFWKLRSGFLSLKDLLSFCKGKSFKKKEDFEKGDFAATPFSGGAHGKSGMVVCDSQKVISGRFSAYGKGDLSKSEWCEFLYSDKKKLALEREGSYTVTFKYKAVEAPGADGFYYFVVRTTAGDIANDKAFTKWSDVAGATGNKTIGFTLGDFDDYYLIWGIHKQGALSIDDIKIVKRK